MGMGREEGRREEGKRRMRMRMRARKRFAMNAHRKINSHVISDISDEVLVSPHLVQLDSLISHGNDAKAVLRVAAEATRLVTSRNFWV